MKRLLDELLPRVMPTMAFCCVVHEGREDLEKSIPRTVRAWREPGVRFVVMRDQDGSDCHEVKARLGCLVRQGGRPDVLVRVVCRELEAWYLGEPEALATAYGDARLRQLANRARFRNPDTVVRPSQVLAELVPGFRKVAGARLLGRHLTRSGNRSRSFRALMDGLDRIAAELEADPGQVGR